MKKKLLLLALIVFTTTTIRSQPDVSAELPSARIACGPWLQKVGETEFTVMWRTTVNSAVWVEVAPDDGSHFYAVPRQKYYQVEHGRRPTGKLHAVTVSGLEAGWSYRYRIFQQAVLSDEGNKRVILGEPYGSDILKTKPFIVTTLDRNKEKCRFSVFNDIHADDKLFRELAANVVTDAPDLVIFNGDMLTQIETTGQIEDGYLRAASDLFAGNIPLYALRGNHEFRGSASYDFTDYFPAVTGKTYFTVRQGPAFMVMMDCGEDKPDSDIRYYGLSMTDRLREEQAEWLETVVRSDEFKSAPVKIVVIHMPPQVDGWWGTREIARLYISILNSAGVDLMICGHNHRHMYIKPGERDNSFPILVNSNVHRADVVADKDGITICVFDRGNKQIHTIAL